MDDNNAEAIMAKTTEELWQLVHAGLRAFIAKRVNDQGHVWPRGNRVEPVFMALSVGLLKIRFAQHAHDVDAGSGSLEDYPIIASP
jgi:hypothetical protein